MSDKLEANESDSLLSAALSDAYRKRDVVDVWDDDALRQFRKDYPRADIVPLAIVESTIIRLQKEIASRNGRALEGDKYKAAFDKEYERAEKAEAERDALRRLYKRHLQVNVPLGSGSSDSALDAFIDARLAAQPGAKEGA